MVRFVVVSHLLNALWSQRHELLQLDHPSRAASNDPRRIIRLPMRESVVLLSSTYLMRRCYADLFSILAETRASWTSDSLDYVVGSLSGPAACRCPDVLRVQPNQGTCFTGSPGIGKTSATPYFIVRFLMQDPSILFIWYMDKSNQFFLVHLDQTQRRIAVQVFSGNPFDSPLVRQKSTILFWNLYVLHILVQLSFRTYDCICCLERSRKARSSSRPTLCIAHPADG